MIAINRSPAPATFTPLSARIVGIGGAGSSMIDRLLIDGMDASQLIAVNTDAQSLSSSVAAQRIQLGHALTHGLGAGGDPEVGMAAAQDALPELRKAVEGVQVVFIAAGLGGGTGSGAAPFMAHAAREAGALVVALVTLPFHFEGKRRNDQARTGLDHLQQLCHAVICFENDRMSEIVSPKAGIQQAFLAADQTFSECLRGILGMLSRPGLMKVGLDELLTVLRGKHAQTIFGYGEAEGDNRAHEALAHALRNPLMHRGKLLEDASNLLVYVSGAGNLTLAEVEVLMTELNRHIADDTRILLGTGIDLRLGSKMSVTLISSLGNEKASTVAKPTQIPLVVLAQNDLLDEIEEAEQEPTHPEPGEETLPVAAKVAPPNPRPRPRLEPVVASVPAEKSVQVKQEVLQFEPISRGRFEKSEPTIVEGHDLDIPTVLRKGFRI